MHTVPALYKKHAGLSVRSRALGNQSFWKTAQNKLSFGKMFSLKLGKGGRGKKKEERIEMAASVTGVHFSEVKMTAVPSSTTCDFVIFAPTAHSFLSLTAFYLHSFYLALGSVCSPLLPQSACYPLPGTASAFCTSLPTHRRLAALIPSWRTERNFLPSLANVKRD